MLAGAGSTCGFVGIDAGFWAWTRIFRYFIGCVFFCFLARSWAWMGVFSGMDAGFWAWMHVFGHVCVFLGIVANFWRRSVFLGMDAGFSVFMLVLGMDPLSVHACRFLRVDQGSWVRLRVFWACMQVFGHACRFLGMHAGFWSWVRVFEHEAGCLCMLASFFALMLVFGHGCGFFGMDACFWAWVRVFGYLSDACVGYSGVFMGRNPRFRARIRLFWARIGVFGRASGFLAVCGFLDIDAGFGACTRLSG